MMHSPSSKIMSLRHVALVLTVALAIAAIGACTRTSEPTPEPTTPPVQQAQSAVTATSVLPADTPAPTPDTRSLQNIGNLSGTLEATPTSAPNPSGGSQPHPATTPPADTPTTVPPTAVPPTAFPLTDTPTPVPPTNAPAPPSPPTGNRVGQSAPDFEVTTIDGITRSLTDFKQASQPVVLYFFASW